MWLPFNNLNAIEIASNALGLVSHSSNHGGGGCDGSRKCPQCTYCHKMGYAQTVAIVSMGGPLTMQMLLKYLLTSNHKCNDLHPFSLLEMAMKSTYDFEPLNSHHMLSLLPKPVIFVTCLAHSSLGPWDIVSGASTCV